MSSPEIVLVSAPSAKRQRVYIDLTQDVEGDSSVPGAVSSLSAAAATETVASSADRSRHDEPAFWLNKLQGAANDYAYSLSDLVPDGNVQYLVISAFMYDMDWVARAAPKLLAAKETLILHGHKDPAGAMALSLFAATRNDRFPERHITVFAPTVPHQYGTHHTKLIAFVCDTGLRIVIHTANMLEGDFTLKTQGAFIRDFPRKTTAATAQPSRFEQDLDDYFAHTGSHSRKFRDLIAEFDFSRAGAQLVAAVPGDHNNHKYGFRRVAQILRRRHYPAEDPLVCQCSSLGSLNSYWMKMFCSSFATSDVSVKLVWPTREQVRTSVAGWASGGSLACSRKNMKPIIKKMLHTWDADESRRSNYMPHIKSYCRGSAQRLHWMLLSSANLSQVAWGSPWNGKYSIQSFELGVMLLPDLIESPGVFLGGGLGTFRATVINSNAHFIPTAFRRKKLDDGDIPVPLPYKMDPSCYKDDDDEPWVWDEPISELDVLGNPWEV